MELIVCGWDEVFAVDPDARPPRKLWSWRAAPCRSLPEGCRALFGSTDDCKPVDGGRQLLIPSSGGAAALVDRKTGEAVFCGKLVNAHSAEMLPGGRIAWVQAEAGEWWAPRIRFLHPAGELHMPGERIYKVRWDGKDGGGGLPARGGAEGRTNGGRARACDLGPETRFTAEKEKK
jgi:hypothetical protein